MFQSYIFKNSSLNVEQACQTQTTSWAAKETKTSIGAAEMPKSPELARFY